MNERLKELYAEQRKLFKVLDKVRLNEINREIYAINEQLKAQQKKQQQIEHDIKTHNNITRLLEYQQRSNKN